MVNTRTSVRRKSMRDPDAQHTNNSPDPTNKIDSISKRLKLSDKELQNDQETDLMFGRGNYDVKPGDIGYGLSPQKKYKTKEPAVENETQ